MAGSSILSIVIYALAIILFFLMATDNWNISLTRKLFLLFIALVVINLQFYGYMDGYHSGYEKGSSQISYGSARYEYDDYSYDISLEGAMFSLQDDFEHETGYSVEQAESIIEAYFGSDLEEIGYGDMTEYQVYLLFTEYRNYQHDLQGMIINAY